MLRRRSRRVRLAHDLHRRRASRRADVRGHGQDSDHHIVRRCARRVSEGPRSRREAARDRCPSFLRGGGGQGSRLCARVRGAGQHRRYQSRVRRSGDQGRRPRVEGERRRTPHGARARGRTQERPCRRAAALHRARDAISERRARPDAAREHLLRPSGVSGRGRSFRKGNEDRRQVLAAVQPAGLCLPVPRPVRAGGDRVQEVRRAHPRRSEPVRLVCRAADEDGALRRVDRDVQEGARHRRELRRVLHRHRQRPAVQGAAGRGARDVREDRGRRPQHRREAHRALLDRRRLRARGRHRQGASPRSRRTTRSPEPSRTAGRRLATST